MAFGYNYSPYQPGYSGGYMPPMPDQLAQLRQNQMQQPIQNPMQPTQAQQAQPPASNGIIWVQGEEGAKAYLVAAGSSVLLMDSENSAFYIKSTDGSGMPMPLRVFDYTERTAAPKSPQVASRGLDNEYVTRREYDELSARVEALAAEKQSAKPGKKSTKEDVENG